MRFDLFIELGNKPVALVVLYRDIADGRGDKGTDGIDDDVLHRIAQRLAPDEHRAVCEHELLHIEPEQTVKGELVYLPQRADSDCKAKSEEGNEERRKVEYCVFVPIDDGYYHKAEKAEHKTAEAVQN